MNSADGPATGVNSTGSADPQPDVADRSLSKFLSFISHDLRGGLNGAVLMLDVMRRRFTKDPSNAGTVEELNLVRRSILDTISSMERYVIAEKLRLGRIKANKAPIDVPKLLDELHKNHIHLLAEQEAELKLAAPDGLLVNSDAHLLAIILQNLLMNAIQFGRRGVIELHVATGTSAPSGVFCRFIVEDHGPGIAGEKLEKLFSPLSPQQSFIESSGLGLFIARRAADLISAKLSAESKVGEGAKFYVDLVEP